MNSNAEYLRRNRFRKVLLTTMSLLTFAMFAASNLSLPERGLLAGEPIGESNGKSSRIGSTKIKPKRDFQLASASETKKPQPRQKIRVIVPAYFYPAGNGLKDWTRLTTAAKSVPLLAIVNPASGAGKGVDPAYTLVLDRAHKGGVTLLGYVSTRYGKRPAQEVMDEMEKWVKFYPQIRGFFLDEQASGPQMVLQYASYFRHAQKTLPNGLVVSNPGVICDEGYLSQPTAHVICIYENSKGFDAFVPPVWARRYSADCFFVLPHSVADTATMQKHVADAGKKGLKSLYVTDDVMPNPWDRLPTYWLELIAAVEEHNRTAK